MCQVWIYPKNWLIDWFYLKVTVFTQSSRVCWDCYLLWTDRERKGTDKGRSWQVYSKTWVESLEISGEALESIQSNELTCATGLRIDLLLLSVFILFIFLLVLYFLSLVLSLFLFVLQTYYLLFLQTGLWIITLVLCLVDFSICKFVFLFSVTEHCHC